MQVGFCRVGVPQLTCNVRCIVTSSAAASKACHKLYSHKQNKSQTYVLSQLLHNSYVSIQKLAQKANSAQLQLARHMHTGKRMSDATSTKELDLSSYDIIGFDLDGTLLRYNLQEMSTLIYNVLKQHMVEQKGYSRALLDKQLDMDFLQKGLLLDGPRGNVLKLSNTATILRASHGTRKLSDAEIVATYGPERRLQVANEFYKDPLSTWNGPAAEEMRTLLDYFDMPSALVFAQAVDVVDADSSQANEYHVWQDLLETLMHNYSRDHFGNNKSLYFKAMRADPQRYVLRSSSKLVNWLHQLRASGKKIFLLTGSNIDFAELTATQAFGPNWQQLFDIVATYAKKPGFFTQQRPFLRVDNVAKCELPNSELSLQETLVCGEVYSQGNWTQLHQSLAKDLKKDAGITRGLYFGDNIIQDVYTPVQHAGIECCAIAEELLLLEQADYPYTHVLGSQFWDSYFSVDKQATLWSGFIAKYAKICVSSMDQMAQTTPTQHIHCSNAHGFYPALPKQLEDSNLLTI